LVIAERIGKAVRSPAKDTLLSHATAVTGRGRGFAVHEALDQVGAVIGPLTVAAVLAVTDDDYRPALGVLAVPGAAALGLLVWLLLRVPEPARYETNTHQVPAPKDAAADASPRRVPPLPAAFWAYSAFTATTMIGFSTFGVLSFHMVTDGILSAAAVPLVYASAMGADAVAALASGWAYDRFGAKTLAALPIVSGLIPAVAFSSQLWLVVTGALLWGAAVGIQESTLRAVVADLVAPPRRATAYGVFAAGLGVATAMGGALTGWLYDESISALIIVVVVIQVAAVGVAIATSLLRRRSVRV
jgi:MFS family permease